MISIVPTANCDLPLRHTELDGVMHSPSFQELQGKVLLSGCERHAAPIKASTWTTAAAAAAPLQCFLTCGPERLSFHQIVQQPLTQLSVEYNWNPCVFNLRIYSKRKRQNEIINDHLTVASHLNLPFTFFAFVSDCNSVKFGAIELLKNRSVI
ncbi:hypothetical protein F2P81_012140 [Scophthalmus maximus]|uniref:Uncharacterized protein n=1 Tax=Scophthalmus maximus TaxID=52904 RepID=A0A6A4SWD9_SCOMX|nr:hypothetical protein F2P81_012140 [Scophthalmus maximus]